MSPLTLKKSRASKGSVSKVSLDRRRQERMCSGDALATPHFAQTGKTLLTWLKEQLLRREGFTEIFKEMEANDSRHWRQACHPFGDKMKLLENARIMTYLYVPYVGKEIWRTFEKILCDVDPGKRAINTRMSSNKASIIGVLSAVHAGELIRTNRY
ncbi:hypothetical protein AVEN_229115-1 [Araneus ventricosus]|uniref:Uncharacterized protein n=1 Tax=Araneus ventricosus TaxID=182803 RepID=A0A4Y2FLY9_ARAVE|nr:hypothetical protein AVEN_229115-1 [Araneus ventricosus]